MFKVNNINTRKRCKICSMLTIKTSEWRHWRWSGIFIVNFEHISHLFLVFLLSTFNKYMLARLCLPVSSSVFRTLSNIYEQAFFCKILANLSKLFLKFSLFVRFTWESTNWLVIISGSVNFFNWERIWYRFVYNTASRQIRI